LPDASRRANVNLRRLVADLRDLDAELVKARAPVMTLEDRRRLIARECNVTRQRRYRLERRVVSGGTDTRLRHSPFAKSCRRNIPVRHASRATVRGWMRRLRRLGPGLADGDYGYGGSAEKATCAENSIPAMQRPPGRAFACSAAGISRRGAPRPRRHNRRGWVYPAVGALAWLLKESRSPGPLAVDKVVIIVREDDGGVADQLERAGVIDNAMWFNVLILLDGNRGALKRGEYAFTAAMSMNDIENDLVAHRVVRYKLTIPVTSEQIVQRLRDDTVLIGDIKEVL
jgi:YceG-like Ter operon protein